jgi:hypothetical protein
MRTIVPFLILFLLTAGHASAAETVKATYSCKVTPDDKVIMAVTNPFDFTISCTLDCQFKFPGGSASTSCSQPVPANVTDHEICVKSTGGDKYTLREGSLECYKQQP